MAIPIEIQNRRFLVPEPSDPCTLWVGYFDSLTDVVGTSHARVLWLITWKSNGNTGCTTNPEFNRWLTKNKIDVSSAVTRTIADLTAIGGHVTGMGKQISGILSKGIPILLGLVLVAIGVMLWKSSRQMNLTDLAMLTPVGRGSKAGLQLLRR